MDVKIYAALIGALAGLIGGSVSTVASHFLGLEATRHELLEAERRSAYVDWLEVRELNEQVYRLREQDKADAADLLEQRFDLEGSQVLGRLAIYGNREVVNALSVWVRSEQQIKLCAFENWQQDIAIYQSMRASLFPEQQAVSDNDLSVILFRCAKPTSS